MDTESAQQQDARVEHLWRILDTRGEGQLNAADLKKGLAKMDHPLKHADELLGDVLHAVDTNKDGKIQFQEFCAFIKETERELWSLYKSIDSNHDGKLDKNELRAAFSRAGLAVPNSKLDRFFSEVDTDHDGVISFEEWRDFLIFLPTHTTTLQSVLSYYSSTVQVNPEGDVVISDETIQGLGTKLFNSFFGSIVSIAKPPRRQMVFDEILSEAQQPAPLTRSLPPGRVQPVQLPSPDVSVGDWTAWESWKPTLIACVPNPGYFVAGGLAGIVSRSTTAPLDRLKVYLIAQTGVAQKTIEAAKSGAPLKVAKSAWRPLADACKELWAAGGMRSLYAGNGLNVIKVMPESAIKFGSYEASKRVFAKLEGHNDPDRIQSWSKFVCGGVGGMISQFAVYPIDTLKFRMQCETVAGGLHGNRLIIATAKKMWARNGIVSFYRGLPMGLVGIFPYAALDLGTFEYLKRAITVRNARKNRCHEEDAQPGSWATAFIGGFSGAFGASVVYPLNLLRTRLQSQGTAIHPRTYTGIMDVTRQTIQGEGFRGLFKGLTPNLLKVVPAVSITYVVYENSKKLLDLH
ncbi:hypothetical protein H2201_002327 [Coniosporium apollinis]|uniref:Mitochondrial thiamine pyrophosphate carrier 1 n=1 Tax=Coniosporium apollinis TaxID=61459 RepID=A0ABQ9P1N8_9PEZI|nr:hypothetical protein H2201_002327 [Coniosporium apollinis]